MIKGIKKADVLVALFLIMVSSALMIFQSKSVAEKVHIEVNGNLYACYDLKNDREVVIETDFGRNVICIENSKVFVTDSSCNDKLEIHAGCIEKTGQSLVCLPNRLVITLKGEVSTDVNTY